MNTRKYKGKTLREWAREKNINPNTLRTRIITYGWSWERALSTPVQGPVHKGKTAAWWSKEKNIGLSTLGNRVYTKGWSWEKALNTPVIDYEAIQNMQNR